MTLLAGRAAGMRRQEQSNSTAIVDRDSVCLDRRRRLVFLTENRAASVVFLMGVLGQKRLIYDLGDEKVSCYMVVP